jgi:hypothetical protein
MVRFLVLLVVVACMGCSDSTALDGSGMQDNGAVVPTKIGDNTENTNDEFADTTRYFPCLDIRDSRCYQYVNNNTRGPRQHDQIDDVLQKQIGPYIKKHQLKPRFVIAWSHGMATRAGAMMSDDEYVYYFDIFYPQFLDESKRETYKEKVWKAKLPQPVARTKLQEMIAKWKDDIPFGQKALSSDLTLFYIGFYDMKEKQYTGYLMDYFPSLRHPPNSKMSKLLELVSEYTKTMAQAHRVGDSRKKMIHLQGRLTGK